MTLTQLEYIIAVDTYRSFSQAAVKCFVTQPTLSMQIQKLEDELGVTLFDRQKKPIVTTEIGQTIINQSREIIRESKKIKSLITEFKGELNGEISIGILPTIAPYLLPLFLPGFIKKFPLIHLKIEELTTDQIIDKLQKDLLDIGILATPIEQGKFHESTLYQEKLMLYISPTHPLFNSKTIDINEVDPDEIWLLAKGHCFRNQAIRLCEMKKNHLSQSPFTFESGSIETILRILENQPGITIIPEMAALRLDKDHLGCVKPFFGQETGRQVSLISRRSYLKQGTILALQQYIIDHLPSEIKNNNLAVLPIGIRA